ncbi:MAG: DNA mismatch repair endonuclease MutL [Sphingobacteriales bacterium]|nr:MAG: DNA mismatch repair endonuclease MutL [Sphingobacteriales bacterium]
MPDIIQLLPDNIANQIAAGEVIQRPASAVKELLENAVDAGATEIKLFINDAGKSLIQVIDNGKGMSDTDARMAFERHATSKISNIEDLFRIKTMGFRGEALASIAAVAQVALKTKRAEDETGTFIEIENSKVLRQEPIASANGTSIAMKNVFFNVPARRNFLKSNAAEMRHIVDEFIRVAMAFPEVLFSLTSNGQQVFYLERGSLKQRIVQLLGANYNARLVTVQEKTDYLNIYGFIGKPETAKKTRGDQYFFVNNRFIKSGYLNHAVSGAYHDLLAPDSFATYVLFIDLDPAQIDINVHPTKQEIKFEDEKIVYAFVQAAIKHALAQFSITPTLEFDLDPTIQQLDAVNKPFTTDKQQAATASDIFKNFTQKHQAHFTEADKKNAFQHWRNPAENKADEERQFSSLLDQVRKEENTDTLHFAPAGTSSPVLPDSPLLQLHSSFIVATLRNGFMVIYQQHAHERILYEQFIAATEGKPMATQRSLFPVTLQFTPQDAVLLQELLPDLQLLGFLIESFGANSFVIQGTPADVLQGNEKAAIENLLEQFKHYSSDVKFSSREKVIRSLVMQQSIKAGQRLTEKEMKILVSNLFECRQPNATASGHPTYAVFENDYLFKLFGK